jgi:hypothetical protein
MGQAFQAVVIQKMIIGLGFDSLQHLQYLYLVDPDCDIGLSLHMGGNLHGKGK